MLLVKVEDARKFAVVLEKELYAKFKTPQAYKPILVTICQNLQNNTALKNAVLKGNSNYDYV